MHRRLSLGAAALAVAAAAFAVYSGSLRNGFAWDDHIYIEGNAFVAEPSNYKKILSPRFWTRTDEAVSDAARPVFVLSLLADRALWGEKPRGYHLTNVLIHAAASVLVLPVSLIVLPPPAAVLAALIFAVHPANSEAVELASFRPDLLAAFFVLAALWLHWSWRRRKSPAPALAGLCGCAALYGLGLLSKEMAITFPALALALEQTAWPAGEKRGWGRLAAAMAVYGAVALGYLAWRAPRSGYSALAAPKPSCAPQRPGGAAKPAAREPAPPKPAPEQLRTFPPSEPQWSQIYQSHKTRALTMSGVLAQELGVLAFGGPLRVDRAPVIVDSARDARAWRLWMLLALAAALAGWAWRRGQRAPGLALAWVLIAWLPVSNLVAIYNPIAERYLYLLSVGAAWALAWALRAAAGRLREPLGSRTAGALACALALSFALRARERNKDWQDDDSLFGREASMNAGNARVFYNLGVQARDRRDDASAERWFRKAVSLNPRYVEAQTNLAALLCEQGKTAPCAALLRQAVAEKPTNFIPYLALAQALTRQNKPREAVAWYQKAYEASSRLDRASAMGLAQAGFEAGQKLEEGLAALRGELAKVPDDAQARRLFALISWRLGRLDIAASQTAGKPAAPPDAGAYVALGRLLAESGRPRDAAQVYRRALRAEPGNKDANDELGLLFMKAQRYDLGAMLLEKAVAADPKDALSLMNLGVCHHHLGRLAQAEEELRSAVEGAGSRAPFYYNLGAAYLDDPARAADAARALRKAVDLSADYDDAWYNLGVAMLKLGRKQEALDDFQRTLALAPKRIEALNNASALLIEQGRPAQAETLLRKALSLRPDHPSLHNNMGELLLSVGRLDEAGAEFQRAIDDGLKLGDDQRDLERYRSNLALCRQKREVARP